MNPLLSRSRGLAGLLGFVMATAFAAAVARAGDPQVSSQEDASSPLVVKIHADWCGTCTRIEEPLEALRQKQGDQARYVVLDVTDREAVSASQAEADRLGIRAFFDKYKGKTGTVGVLNGATRETVSVLKGEMDVVVYEEALATARGVSPS